jgi:hypothetical protein
MNFDENFQQEMRDYFRFEAQRHSNIMATLAEVLTKLVEKITAFTAAATAHNAEIKKALGILADTGAAGHAAVLDQIEAKIETINSAETIGTMTSELVAAIGQTPTPKP